MDSFFWQAFSLVCGQNPDHTWVMGSDLLPLCQRCTGLYLGAGVCLILHCFLRPALGGGFLALHGLLILSVAPFGFQWVDDTPVLRAITGVFCGFGIATFLWVAPASVWDHEPSTARRFSVAWYAAALGVMATIVPLVGLGGGVATGWVWKMMAAVGVVLLGGLSLASAVLGLRGVLRYCHPFPRPRPHPFMLKR